MIVDVICDDDTVQIAQIITEDEHSYGVLFLNKKKDVYKFSDEITIVPKESVGGFYDVNNLEETGLYVMTSKGYELIDDSEDEDFEYSETDESDSDVTLVDEDEA
jgi:hypothetical protein